MLYACLVNKKCNIKNIVANSDARTNTLVGMENFC